MMRIWGMLSEDDEKAGFDLILDEDWQVLLMLNSKPIAKFNPLDYTQVELLTEINRLTQAMDKQTNKPVTLSSD